MSINHHAHVAMKKSNRNNTDSIQSRWVFATPNAYGVDAKTHRPTLSLRWSKTNTL